MCEALNGRGHVEHRTVAIFETGAGNLQPDIRLGVRGGRLRRIGLDPRAVWSLSRRVRASRPSVVVAHGGEPLKYAVVATPPAIPIVYYKIGVTAERLRGRLHRALYTGLLKRVSLVAGVSSEAVDEAVALFGVSPTRTVLIPNGRTPSLFPPRDWPPEATPPHVVFVGAVTASKRPELFLRLIGRLRAGGVQLRASMIGDGPDLESLRSLATASEVELLGRRSDVPDLMRTADLLVFPSCRAGEGMPGVLIEAGLAGLPVVATQVPGVHDVVQHGETGLVVPEHDEEALFQATLSLVLAPSLRCAYGAAARRRCLDRFTLDESIRSWEASLGELTGQGSRRSSASTVKLR